jgi:hypothetical protein
LKRRLPDGASSVSSTLRLKEINDDRRLEARRNSC